VTVATEKADGEGKDEGGGGDGGRQTARPSLVSQYLSQNFFLTELRGHAGTVAASAAAMAFAGYLSASFEAESYTAANVSAEALPGLVPSVLLAGLSLLPALFVTLGMYALVDASEEVFRYEVGVYASQGIDGHTLVDTWSSLYGWIPSLAYVLGLAAYFLADPRAFSELQAVLADIVGGLLLVSALPGFFLVPRRLYAMLDRSPYVVLRS